MAETIGRMKNNIYKILEWCNQLEHPAPSCSSAIGDYSAVFSLVPGAGQIVSSISGIVSTACLILKA